MAVDIGGDDGLQQHEEGEQAEGGVEAGLMGDEADDGGAHEDAEVAECADGWHGEADGHDALLAEQGEEDGHDVGAADADGEEAEVEQHRLSGEDDEQEAGDGQQAATSVIYTPLDAKSISFSCDGTVLMDVEKYDLEV